jgi:hypothetical protein
MQALERIGFENADCYFKYGLRAMFGGSKGNHRLEPVKQ